LRENSTPAYWACRSTAELHTPATAYGNGVYGTAGTDTAFAETFTETDAAT